MLALARPRWTEAWHSYAARLRARPSLNPRSAQPRFHNPEGRDNMRMMRGSMYIADDWSNHTKIEVKRAGGAGGGAY
jgi:hypothetical protein